MKRIDLTRDKGSGVFDFQSENFQALVSVLKEATKKELLCREDSTQSRCKVELAIPFGLGGQDGIARFHYKKDTVELIVSMLDVNKFGTTVWDNVVECLKTIARDAQCNRIIFKNDPDSGDIRMGCIPTGAIRQPNSVWVFEIE